MYVQWLLPKRQEISVGQCGKKVPPPPPPVHCWWECKLVQPLWNTEWKFLKKLKIELPYDSVIPLSGYISERN